MLPAFLTKRQPAAAQYDLSSTINIASPPPKPNGSSHANNTGSHGSLSKAMKTISLIPKSLTKHSTPHQKQAYTVKDLRTLYSRLLTEISTSTAGTMIDAWSLLNTLTPAPPDANGVVYQPDKQTMKVASELEERVIELLRRLGEVVVFGEQVGV